MTIPGRRYPDATIPDGVACTAMILWCVRGAWMFCPNLGRYVRYPATKAANLARLRGGVLAEFLIGETAMQPRQVLLGQFYMITRRCTQRQFLLRPDAETKNAFTYCLIEAAQRCEVEVLMTCAMSNHHHTVIFDRHGRYPEFIEHFHKMVARSQNALRGRWENFWSSEQTCVVRLVDREAVMDKLVYAAANPVKDHLVDRVHHWPGANGLRALLSRKPMRATRPRHFFRRGGKMPEDVEMKLIIPPELGPEDEVLAELEQRVASIEAKAGAERQQTGRLLMGRRRVLAQSWRSQPGVPEPRGNLRPQVATRSKWARIEALLRNRAFVEEYARARAAWREGLQIEFPAGTYWLRRFAHVAVASMPT